MIPCITKKSINFLYGTADERYNFSKDFFRKTHFPQTLNRYYKNQLIESVTESELLEELEEGKDFGNRVYVIFGSTGSGKSELLCWLRDQWTPDESRPIIRISRTELNPQILVKKCYESIGFELGDLIIDENRWNLLLTKPISIINQMVWTTISEFFESDDSIVPAAMLLRPVIEKNILEFTKQIKDGHIIKPLEFITKEEYENLIESTSIGIDIHYHKFRDSLLKKFDQFLFQGTDIKTIFKELSNTLLEKNIRPVLLIDDLVQSINLYAADLLDYFITLEDGNWDVIIGLTPGVEQGQDFDHDLKSRIKNLDTIDDRVKKLWLSDESGSNFFTLDKKQAQTYMEKYLVGLKEANGFACSTSCPHANSCGALLEDDSAEGLKLLPFSMPLINRVYDGIPKGKGTLRYLILNSREILQFLVKGEAKAATKIAHYLNRDVFIEHEDKLVKILGEMYAHPNEANHVITASLVKHFKYDLDDIVLQLKNLQIHKEVTIEEHIIEKKNVVVEHIRDWIEGNKVKEQLLEPVRTGVATIVHEVVKGTFITKEHTSRAIKSTAAIQRAEVVNRYKYPISFSERNNTQIFIDKNINLLQIANFQQLKMQDRSDMFAKVANDKNIADWVYQTEQLKDEWITELEEGIGYSVSNFAFLLKMFINKVSRLGQSEWTSIVKNPIKKDYLEVTEDLFLDWFSLRDNIIDFHAIDSLNHNEDFSQKFLTLMPSKKLNKFQIKNFPLQMFLVELQKSVSQYLEELQPVVFQKVNEIKLLQKLLDNISNSEKLSWVETVSNKTSLTLDDMIHLDEIISWLSTEDNKEFITKVQQEQAYVENMRKFLPLMTNKENSKLQSLDLTMMEKYLKNNLNVRTQVRKHLLRLLEKGETQLPKKHWKGILRDMEEINPEIFDYVHVNVNMRK
ncbi:hypothetical protein V7147_15295 [Bacillus sp. JJ1521]|uniref:hypothetical protein n=1 Tax=Bacillus sp. JJ1521 TaxID=3122957 RepID=UPI002FFD86C5